MGQSSNEEEDLFSAAVALPVTERDGYLRRVCGENTQLLARLQTLLEATADAASFVRDRFKVGQFEGAGDRIGCYRLVQELGEGGCGVAYLAEQSAPVQRDVALKIIKPGMDTKEVIARFETERQALAIMDHPNIAKVFDAGVSPGGRPYFVLELVRGIKITEYCNQSRLTVAERLALIIQVCHAIQHAHHKGIIHRDIKPSNVLVTLHDGVPIAKVIDFGLAKAMQGRLTDQTVYTAVEQFLGTPAYVSPEQTDPGQLAVDTRSDVYSLGVLLYELLTGYTPFGACDLLQPRADLMQRIRVEEPLRPSKRLANVSDALVTRAPALYGTTATKLLRQLQGDLDWIVMRCLAKEPERRYQTANDLSLDLERHLRHEAVLARPPSVAYSVRKFARRHRLASVAAAAFVLFIMAFTITISVQAQRIAAERDRAEQQREQAEQISNMLLNVFAAADPFQNFEHELTAPELLDQAAPKIKDELERSEARARLLEAVGRAYRRRGEAGKAVTYLDDAVRAHHQLQAGDGVASVSAMVELSIAQRLSGDLESAQGTLTEASELAKQQRLQGSAVYASLLANRARIELVTNKLPEARKDLLESLVLSREIFGPNSQEVAEVLLTLSRVCQWTDDLVEAERTAQEAVVIFEATVAPMHPNRVLAETRLAEVLYLRDQIDLAEPLFLAALKKHTQLFGRNSWWVADDLDSLARIRRSQGRLEEAETFAREAISVHSAALGEKHEITAYLRTSLAALLIQRAKYDEAELQLRRALEVYRETRPSDDQYIASSEYLLGEVLLATGRLTEAETVLTASMERWQRSGAPPWRAARSASALGEALYRQGRVRDAERYLVESHRELTAATGADLEAKVKARERVALFLQESRQTSRIE